MPQQTPSQLLGPLGDLCMYRAEDWWTYELCFGKAVRQFHKENDRVVSQYDLGQFSEEDSRLDEIHDDGSSAGASGKFVRQASSNTYPMCQEGVKEENKGLRGLSCHVCTSGGYAAAFSCCSFCMACESGHMMPQRHARQHC